MRIKFLGVAATADHQCFGTTKAADGSREPGRYIMHPEGCEADLPVPLLAEHDRNKIIGEVTRILRRPKALHVSGHIDDDGTPETARLLRQIRAGDIRGMSCGFDVLEERGFCDVLRWRLTEVSVTRRPANPETTIALLDDTPPAPAVRRAKEAPAALHRAYSLLTVKRASDDARTITGTATSIETDRMGDVVEPSGAKFKLPMPFLLHHDPRQPIGHVTKAKVTPSGIEIEASVTKVTEPGPLKDRLDAAWQEIRAGLLRGLSIGFRALERPELLKSGGLRFTSYEILETSAVSIPANAAATINAVKNAAGLAPRPAAVRKRAGGGLDLVGFARSLAPEVIKAVDMRMAPLRRRIDYLEAKAADALRFRGVYDEGDDYEHGDLVQRLGTVWVCLAPQTRATPGQSPDWRMLVKSGDKR